MRFACIDIASPQLYWIHPGCMHQFIRRKVGSQPNYLLLVSIACIDRSIRVL